MKDDLAAWLRSTSVPQGLAQRKDQASSLSMVKALGPGYGGLCSRKGVSGFLGAKRKGRSQSVATNTALLRQHSGCAILKGLGPGFRL